MEHVRSHDDMASSLHLARKLVCAISAGLPASINSIAFSALIPPPTWDPKRQRLALRLQFER